MSQMPHDEPLVGEVRFRVPLPIVIPLVALVIIAAVSIAFGLLLVALPHEAALIIAAVTAANIMGACAFIALRGRMGGQSLLELMAIMLYPLLIGFVIVQVGAFEHSEAAAHGDAHSEGEGAAPPAAGGGLTVVAANVAFDTDTIELTAGEATDIAFDNQDSLEHNISIYETQADGVSFTDPLFEGEIIDGGEKTTYAVPALEKGEKYFQCDVHPNMSGTASVK